LKHAFWLLPLVLLFVLPSVAQTDTATASPPAAAATLADRLYAADSGSALDEPDVRPWHLKMSVQLFDAKGKSTDQGTVEEWWGGPDTSRREFKTAAYAATEITSKGKQYRTKGAGSPPLYLSLLLRQAVHPNPPTDEIAASSPALKKETFGSIAMDCIMLTQPLRQPASLPLGFFPTYCLDEKSRLRMSVEYGDQVSARNAIGKFEGKDVPVDILVSANHTTAATAHIDALTDGAILDSEFLLGSELVEARTKRVRVDQAELERPTTTVPPTYPADAKAKHIAGTVVLGVIIGTEGRVLDVKPISSLDSELTNAAMEAVHHWIYKPYVVHNEPVEIETTVTVRFTTGH